MTVEAPKAGALSHFSCQRTIAVKVLPQSSRRSKRELDSVTDQRTWQGEGHVAVSATSASASDVLLVMLVRDHNILRGGRVEIDLDLLQARGKCEHLRGQLAHQGMSVVQGQSRSSRMSYMQETYA